MAGATSSPSVVPAALRALEPRGGLDKNALLTGEAPLAGHFVGHPGRSPEGMIGDGYYCCRVRWRPCRVDSNFGRVSVRS